MVGARLSFPAFDLKNVGVLAASISPGQAEVLKVIFWSILNLFHPYYRHYYYYDHDHSRSIWCIHQPSYKILSSVLKFYRTNRHYFSFKALCIQRNPWFSSSSSVKEAKLLLNYFFKYRFCIEEFQINSACRHFCGTVNRVCILSNEHLNQISRDRWIEIE
jgi:hypothetical protein